MLIYALCGLLLGVGFVIPYTWPLGILGVALLLHRLSVSKDSWKIKLLGTYIAMFIKFLFVLAFYWTMYPIEWLPFDFGSGELAIVALYWVSVASYIACSGFALFGLILISKKVPAPNWLRLLILFPVSWIMSEIFGSYALSIFTLGPGSVPNINFSLGYVGYLIGEHFMLSQLARLGGVYALSFLAIAVAGVIIYFWPKWQNREKIILISILFVLSVTTDVLVPVIENSNSTEKIALISTNTPVGSLFVRENIKKHQAVQAEAMESAINSGAKYIIWPEDSRYFSQLAGGMGAMVFSFTNSGENIVVVDSGVVDTKNGNVLRAEIVDIANKENYIADKRYLVPQGEFMPYLYQILFRAFGLGEVAEKVRGAVSYVVGPEVSQSEFSSNVPSVLFCFESADANGVRKLTRERGDIPFIAHPVSHSWFHEPQSFWSQLDTSLRVQAIWNQVYIASAGNHAPSKLFTPQGRVIKPTEFSKGEYWSVGLVEVPVNN